MPPHLPLDFPARVVIYRRATNASVTSWGRTPAHNRRIGGTTTSLHLDDLAADLVYDDPPPPLTWRQALARALDLTIHPEPDHDHITPHQEA